MPNIIGRGKRKLRNEEYLTTLDHMKSAFRPGLDAAAREADLQERADAKAAKAAAEKAEEAAKKRQGAKARKGLY